MHTILTIIIKFLTFRMIYKENANEKFNLNIK